YTVSVKVMDDDTGVGTASFTVTVNNVAPAVTSAPSSQSVQYSDPIAAVTVSATDVAKDEPFVVGTVYTVNSGPAQSGLPNGLTLSASATSSGLFDTATWTLSGIANVAPGTYVVTVSVTDKDGAAGHTEITITVNQE